MKLAHRSRAFAVGPLLFFLVLALLFPRAGLAAGPRGPEVAAPLRPVATAAAAPVPAAKVPLQQPRHVVAPAPAPPSAIHLRAEKPSGAREKRRQDDAAVTRQGKAGARATSALPAGPAVALPPAQREAYLKVMLEGSLNVSRTKVVGRRFMAPEKVASDDIPHVAEKNFRVAAEYVLDHVDAPLTLETAVTLNKMLTVGLVPENVRGQSSYRRDPALFYKWLDSKEARELQATDPVALAERIHNQIATYDAFPDGNGRTSRLMADLALLKAGRPPAFYTDMNDYFQRGAPRPPATRETQVLYFREIAARGEAATASARETSSPARAEHASEPTPAAAAQ